MMHEAAGRTGAQLYKKALSLIIAFAGVLALPSALLLEGKGLGYSNGFLPVCLLLLALPAIHAALWKEGALRQAGLPAFLLGLGFALATSVGSRLEAEEYLLLTDWTLWLCLLPLALFFGSLVLWLWEKMERLGGVKESDPKIWTRWEQLSIPTRRLLIFLALLAAWGVVLLAVYPGFFVYDAQDEFNQVAQRQFTTHHPLLHVLLLGGIVSAGRKVFGDYNAGIACYMLFQMLVMAGCLVYVSDFLRRKCAPRWLRAASTVYYALFPVIQMYVLCSAKDTLYSAAMLMAATLLADAASSSAWTRGKSILFVASLCLMALMRHNGLYILLILIPVLAVWAGRGKRLRMALLCAAALILALGVNGGLKLLLHAQDNENQELLTVPIQQLARTYAQNPECFTQEEKEELLVFLPEEALASYTPKLSDNVKIYFNNGAYEEVPERFWRLWASVGKKAPGSYLNAWLLTSYGFWYPPALIDVYQGNTVFTFTYEDSSYFGYETELPGERRSFLPWLDEYFRQLSLEISWQRIPILSMLFSPGALFWMYAFGLGFAAAGKRYRMLASFLPAVLNWLTVLLGPTYLVRYVLIWWFALPLLAYVVSSTKLCYTNTKTVRTP